MSNWTCPTCRNNDLLIIAIGVARERYWPQFWAHLAKSNPNVKTLSIDRTPNSALPCYAEALNYGLSIARFYSDEWILLTNNDVEITKPLKYFELSKNVLYGFERHEMALEPDGKRLLFPFICGWAYLAHRSVFEKIGEFDESFKPLFFEDVDYCWRAQSKGIALGFLDAEQWGIKHLDTVDRQDERAALRGDRREQYMRNLAYFRSKHDV